MDVGGAKQCHTFSDSVAVTPAVSGIGMCAAWNTGASGRWLWQISSTFPGSLRLSVLFGPTIEDETAHGSARLLLFWHGASGAFSKVVSSTGHTEFDMRHSLPVYWFTRSCQGQMGQQATLVGLNHGQGHRWGGRGLQCAVSARSLA